MASPGGFSVDRWPGLRVGERISGGTRSGVWRGQLDDQVVALRRSRRSAASLEWELSLMEVLREHSFSVPATIPATDGALHVDGWCVQSWLDGHPPTSADDWSRVASELHRLHFLMRAHSQRPGCVTLHELVTSRTSVDADLSGIPDEVIDVCVAQFEPHLEGQVSLIHGDPGPENIRILADGSIGFIDWDEARLDIAELDFADLGIGCLNGLRQRCAAAAANAWETLNGWNLEPDYASRRFERVKTIEHRSEWPELTDGVVTLRPRDHSEVSAQLAGEDQEIVDWLTGGYATPERMTQHTDHCIRLWRVSGLRRNFGVYVDGQAVGNVELNFADMDLGFEEVNVSYATFVPARRKGYASRALGLIADYSRLIEPNTIPTLKIDPRNAASAAVAASTGFKLARHINRPDVTYEAHQRRSDLAVIEGDDSPSGEPQTP